MSIIIALLTIYFSCFLFLGCDIDQGASDPATAAAAWSFSNGYLPNPCSVACARTTWCEESSCTPNGECAGLYVASGLELCYGVTADDCPAHANPLPCTSRDDVRDPDAIGENEEGMLGESTQSVVDDTVPVDEPRIKDTEMTETKEETVGEVGKEAEAKPKSVVQDEEAQPTETSQSGEELKPQEVADPEYQAERRRGGSEKADLLQGEPSSEEKTKPEPVESHPEAKPESEETESKAKPESGETESEAKPESGETESEAKPESGETESEAKPEERAEKEVEVQVNPKEVELEGEAESREEAKPEEGAESREEAKPSQESTTSGRVEAMSKVATAGAPRGELPTPVTQQSEAKPRYRAKDPESEEVVPGEIGSAEEGCSPQEQSKMLGSQQEVPSEHWLARSPELAEEEKLPAGKPSSHQEAAGKPSTAEAASEPTEGGLGQAMSPESEGASGGETSTQEKPSCPYLRGEGYTALPTSEGEKAGPTAAPGAAGATATDIGEAKATETSEGEATETSEGEATETSEGEVTKTSEGEATETSEGEVTKTSEGEATETSEGKATETSEDEVTKTSEGEVTKTSEDEVTKTSEGEATETSEGKATETSEGEVTKTSEGEVTKTSEGEVTKTSEGEATETAEGKIIETTTKATEEKASGTSQGKASAATRAETTETSKSEETEILVEVGGTGGPTPAEGWITTPGSASASPSSEELFREHEGLATGIGSHGGERVEASRIPTAAGTTTLPTEPGPITSQPAEEVPYKLVYEPPVLHHGDEPATSWTDERVATHERLEVSTEKPSDSQPLEDASWYRSGEEGSLDIGFWYFRGHDRHRDQHHHDRDHDQHRDHGHRRRHRDDRRQRDHRH